VSHFNMPVSFSFWFGSTTRATQEPRSIQRINTSLTDKRGAGDTRHMETTLHVRIHREMRIKNENTITACRSCANVHRNHISPPSEVQQGRRVIAELRYHTHRALYCGRREGTARSNSNATDGAKPCGQVRNEHSFLYLIFLLLSSTSWIFQP
jgi:hypothetical protein